MRPGRSSAEDGRIRFGCGFAMGVAIGLFVLVFYVSTPLVLAVLTMGVALLSGWLAAHHGDRFWVRVLRWLPWI